MLVQITVRVMMVIVMILFAGSPQASAMFLQRHHVKSDFSEAAAICKVKIVKLTETDTKGFFESGGYFPCVAECEVIDTFKGKVDEKVTLVFNRGHMHFFSFVGKVGETCLVQVNDKGRIFAGVTAMENKVDPTFGEKTADKLLAEFIAMSKSDKLNYRMSGLIGLAELGDPRGGEEASLATKDKNEHVARLGILAQYAMKIPPDLNRLMELFDSKLLDAAYKEAGEIQQNAQGGTIMRTQVLDRKTTQFIVRGMSDFDYAGFIREGIKHEWVRKDEHTLYIFFGVPWKVQRKACVPELIQLLSHDDMRVRWWADKCLNHTVNNEHSNPSWEEYQKLDAATVKRWKAWWKTRGDAYMSEEAGAP